MRMREGQKVRRNKNLAGGDGSWMGDYATYGRPCHLAHAARFALAPRLPQRYDR